MECGDLSPHLRCRIPHAGVFEGNACPSILWPHAPEHRLTEAGAYMVTAGTYQKENRFSGPERLAVLHRGLLRLAAKYNWTLEAWAVFSNHYHFVAQAPVDGASNLSVMLKELHMRSLRFGSTGLTDSRVGSCGINFGRAGSLIKDRI